MTDTPDTPLSPEQTAATVERVARRLESWLRPGLDARYVARAVLSVLAPSTPDHHQLRRASKVMGDEGVNDADASAGVSYREVYGILRDDALIGVALDLAVKVGAAAKDGKPGTAWPLIHTALITHGRAAAERMRERALEILHEEGWLGESEQRIRALPLDPEPTT